PITVNTAAPRGRRLASREISHFSPRFKARSRAKLLEWGTDGKIKNKKLRPFPEPKSDNSRGTPMTGLWVIGDGDVTVAVGVMAVGDVTDVQRPGARTTQDISTKVESLIREIDKVKMKLPEQKETMKSQWKRPNGPNVKVNFDATFNPNLHQSWLATAFPTKVSTCIQALEFATKMGFQHIEMERDSRTTIVKAQKWALDKSEIGIHIEKIRDLNSSSISE
ncbi:hypothetical protein Godav_009699, partial [Gossypium davidsonii]|nr:hypothetical protein [Gossypium davidsonii]MBA0671638.1 hypothetical protein [Gossypium klotzschianum]